MFFCVVWTMGDNDSVPFVYGYRGCQNHALELGAIFIVWPRTDVVMEHSHTYNELGKYQMKLYAYNTLTTWMIDEEITSTTCHIPHVSIAGNGPSARNPQVVLKASEINLFANVKTQCDLPSMENFTWYFYNYRTNDEYDVLNQTLLFEKETYLPRLHLPSRYLDYGRYFVDTSINHKEEAIMIPLRFSSVRCQEVDISIT